MSEQRKLFLDLRAINKNEQVKRLRTFGDRLADKITSIAGSTGFLLLNILVFAGWILLNTGRFGEHLVFDEYPFGFLTMAVSLEAIILAVFVLISQNRQSRRSDIRSEMDYITDLQADAEINAILLMLKRLSDKEGVDVADVLDQLDSTQKKIMRDHPISKQDRKDQAEGAKNIQAED